jgi:hypothetical protein
MTANNMYSMRISIENDRAYKIRLIHNNPKSDQVLFEFISEKIPTVERVLKLYYLSKRNLSQ